MPMFFKAMGKKIFALLEKKLKPKFLSGCEERGHDVEIAEKYGKTGRLLLPMPSISHTLFAMLSLLFRRLILRHTILQNTWLLTLLTT